MLSISLPYTDGDVMLCIGLLSCFSHEPPGGVQGFLCTPSSGLKEQQINNFWDWFQNMGVGWRVGAIYRYFEMKLFSIVISSAGYAPTNITITSCSVPCAGRQLLQLLFFLFAWSQADDVDYIARS